MAKKKVEVKSVRWSFIFLACALATGFLLLLVDKGAITGKMTAVTNAAVVDYSAENAGLWTIVGFLSLMLIFLVVRIWKKNK